MSAPRAPLQSSNVKTPPDADEDVEERESIPLLQEFRSKVQNEQTDSQGISLPATTLQESRAALPDQTRNANTTRESSSALFAEQQTRAPSVYRPPVTHYRSISVCRIVHQDPTEYHGTLSLVETDVGSENDLYSINLQMHWIPRSAATSYEKDLILDPSGPPPRPERVDVSVDDLLAARVILNARPEPRIFLHARGGMRITSFSFPNGRDAAMAFMNALRKHVITTTIEDRHSPGELFYIESKPRMRRVVPAILAGDDTDLTVRPSLSDGLLTSGDESDSGVATPTTPLSPCSDSDPSSPRAEAAVAAERMSARRRGRAREPGVPTLAVLEQFARVTQFARDVGDDVAWVFSERRRKADALRRERERRARERALDIYADLAWEGAGGDGEDSGRELPPRLVLERKRGIQVRRETWEDGLDKQGRVVDQAVTRLAVFAGGLEGEARKLAWPYLLGVFPWNSTAAQREDIMQRNLDRYAKLKAQWLDLKAEATAADAESLAAAMDLMHGDDVKGAQTRAPERHVRISKAHASYLETEEQIAKDIIRTDRTVDVYQADDSRMLAMLGDILNVYAVHNRSIGYCQGMSDFLSPLLYVFGEHEEAHTFWCFEALMQRVQLNFRIDQTGMNAQLASVRSVLQACDPELYQYFVDTDPDMYCVFRWMLVWFKRELPFEATSYLWEVLWTRQVAGDKLHVYVVVALLRAHRRNLLQLNRGEFDRALRYINDLSMRIDVDFALKQGELCYRGFG